MEDNRNIELNSDVWIHNPRTGFRKVRKGTYRLKRHNNEMQYKLLFGDSLVEIHWVVSGDVISSWLNTGKAVFCDTDKP
jgi:hypothetical protein